ncbi:MAG: ABC transporter permease [Thermoplasmata archaeon]|nr:ABC transporter permease [Thermoplasmata archaeon]
MIYSNEDLSQSFIDGNSLSQLQNYVGVRFINANVTSMGLRHNDTYIASIHDPYDMMVFDYPNETTGNNAFIGNITERVLSSTGFDTSAGARLTLENNYNDININLALLYPTNLIFPNDWIIISNEMMKDLSPSLSNNYSFIIVFEDDDIIQNFIKENDLISRPTTSAVSFFETGIYQVEGNLWSIVLTTGIIVIMLVYSIMSIEIQYHKPTIENLKGLGAKRRVIIGIFTLKAILITVTGGIIGIALGICVANGVISISSLAGINTIIVPLVTHNSLIQPLALSIIAGLVGGLIPSLKATNILGRKEVV